LAVSAANCNGRERVDPFSDATGTGPALTPVDTAIGIADFTLDDLAGKAVNTADARKGKVLVMKFGATWCPPCTQQIPHLNKVAETYAGKVAVIEVDGDEPAARVKAHAQRHKIAYPVLLDTDDKIARAYRVDVIPTVIVADKNGKIVYRGNYTPFKILKSQIDPLLKQPEPKPVAETKGVEQ
jgi:peroxiredoxin